MWPEKKPVSQPTQQTQETKEDQSGEEPSGEDEENDKDDEENTYKWNKIKKENDIWSLALIFMTLIINDRLFYYYKFYY